MDESESTLIAQCRKGDPDAWDRLFDLHYQTVAKFVWQTHGSLAPEDVEEICQETFLTVIRTLDTFKGGSRLQTWICRIAANKAHDHWDRAQAQKRGGGRQPLSLDAEDPTTGLSIDPPSNAPSPDQALLAVESNQWVGASLQRLGQPCREILELRYFGDLSYEEIGSELQMNPKTVSSRLSKCLDKLEEIAKSMTLPEKNQTSSV